MTKKSNVLIISPDDLNADWILDKEGRAEEVAITEAALAKHNAEVGGKGKIKVKVNGKRRAVA